jgi:large subunit ribosomal protein L22
MRAELKNYRQSPRKVRLVADLIKGKSVAEAILQLQYLTKRASNPISKLVQSAAANAQNNFKVAPEGLYIKSLTVDKGVVMKRFRPRSRGMANPVHKHSSHVVIELSQK